MLCQMVGQNKFKSLFILPFTVAKALKAVKIFFKDQKKVQASSKPGWAVLIFLNVNGTSEADVESKYIECHKDVEKMI